MPWGLRLLPNGNFRVAPQWPALVRRWSAAATVRLILKTSESWTRGATGQHRGHEWCHWRHEEVSLRAMVSARSERFAKT